MFDIRYVLIWAQALSISSGLLAYAIVVLVLLLAQNPLVVSGPAMLGLVRIRKPRVDWGSLQLDFRHFSTVIVSSHIHSS